MMTSHDGRRAPGQASSLDADSDLLDRNEREEDGDSTVPVQEPKCV